MIVPQPRKARPAQSISLSKLLLVEGETPLHFFEALARHVGLSDKIEIRSYGGNGDLGTFLRTIAAGADFERMVQSLGIVRDAEDDPTGARQSVESAIRNAGIGKPTSVAILPDDSTAGMIETLLLRSVSDRQEFQCIDQFFECLSSTGHQLSSSRSVDKNFAQVFLATFPDVQVFPGMASYKGAWPLDHVVFQDLKTFLLQL